MSKNKIILLVIGTLVIVSAALIVESKYYWIILIMGFCLIALFAIKDEGLKLFK